MDFKRKYTLEEYAEFEKRYEAERGPRKIRERKRKGIRIVGTETVFPTKVACANTLKVSRTTIERILRGELPESDIRLEYVE